MSLSDLIAADNALLLSTDDFATSVTYRGPDTLEQQVDAVLFDALTEWQNNNGINTLVTTRNITFATTDLAADLRGVFVISGTEWAITRRIYMDQWQTSLELQRHELHEHTRPNYRRS